MTSKTDLLYLLVFTFVLQSASSLNVTDLQSLGLDTFGFYYPVAGQQHQLPGSKHNITDTSLDYDFSEHLRRENVLVNCDGPLCILAVQVQPGSEISNIINNKNSNVDAKMKAGCVKNGNGCKQKKLCGCKVKKPKKCTKGPKDKCAEAKKKIEACKKKCKQKKDEGTIEDDSTTRNPDPYYPDWDPTKSYENYGPVEPYFDEGFLKFKAKNKDLDRKSSLYLTDFEKGLTSALKNTYYDAYTGNNNMNSNTNIKPAQDKITIQAFSSKESDEPVEVNIKPSSLLKKIIGARNAIRNHTLQMVRTKNVTINYREEPKVVRSMNVNMKSKNLDSDTPDFDAFVKELRSEVQPKGKEESRKYETQSGEDDTRILHLTRNETINPGSLIHIAKIVQDMKPEQLFNAIIAHNQRRALKKWKKKRVKKSKKSEESEQEESSESTEQKSAEAGRAGNTSKSKSSETEEEDAEEVEEDNRKHKPKRFQVIDSMINKFVEKELFKFDKADKSAKSSESADTEPLSAEEETTTTTKKPKPKKKFKGPGKPMTIIQAPGRMYKEGEDFRRNRLPYFLPKRYDWDPKEYQKLGYFWFNGPQGRNPGPWRIYY